MKKILIIKGGVSSEHEISLQTGQMIAENLDCNKYDVDQAIIHKDGKWQFDNEKEIVDLTLALKKIQEKKYDLVFIALHGAFGEDGHLQAIFDSVGIKYSGSGMVAAAIVMNKYFASQIYEKNGLVVPKVQKLTDKAEQIKISLPFVVKPNIGGSSIGISIVEREEDIGKAINLAFEQDQEILIQEYIKGREFTCGVLESEKETKALSPIMIVPKLSNFFDYRTKYDPEACDEIVNPDIGQEKLETIKMLSLKAHQLLDCQGFSRSDFIEKDGKFYIIENNIVPGMTENSLLPKSARGSGIEFSELINTIIKTGLRRKL